MSVKQPNAQPRGGRTMRAVSIRQPQAAAILAAPGPFHYPGWRTDHRGPLLIHATSRKAGDPPAGRAASPVFGALLGVVEMVDCVATDRAGGGPDEVGYTWVLARPRAFAAPIPYVGRLGLFEVADAVVADALAALPPAKK